MTAKDILEFAIEMERQAAAYYEKCVHTVKQKKARDLLESLAGEERRHEQRLAQLIGRVDDGHQLPGGDWQKHVAEFELLGEDFPLTEDSSLSDIMLHSIEREKTAGQIYHVFAQLLNGGEFADLCLLLVAEEHDHQAMFENLYREEMDVYNEKPNED